jgi:hypothetical protein
MSDSHEWRDLEAALERVRHVRDRAVFEAWSHAMVMTEDLELVMRWIDHGLETIERPQRPETKP